MKDLASFPSETVEPNELLSIAMLCNVMAVDTETNGKDIRDGRGFAIGISCTVFQNQTFYSAYFPVAHTENNVSEETKQFLFNIIRTRSAIVFHEAKFDLVSLKTAGYTGGFVRWYCTLRMAHMLNENLPNYGLDWLARNELKEAGKNKPIEWQVMFSVYGWSPDFPARIMGLYACEDTVLTLKLFFKLYPYFVKSGFDGSEMPELQQLLQ